MSKSPLASSPDHHVDYETMSWAELWERMCAAHLRFEHARALHFAQRLLAIPFVGPVHKQIASGIAFESASLMELTSDTEEMPALSPDQYAWEHDDRSLVPQPGPSQPPPVRFQSGFVTRQSAKRAAND